jgi:hypothetical protein
MESRRVLEEEVYFHHLNSFHLRSDLQDHHPAPMEGRYQDLKEEYSYSELRN